jgi:hypothetical protein
MQTRLRHLTRAALLSAGVLALTALDAHAARIGVLSNKYAAETAADLAAKIPQHLFAPVDLGAGAPSLDSLLNQFDAVLLFEDGTFAQAPAVGTTVARFAGAGRAVVLGTFYDQDRSDALGSPDITPHGWGELEAIDPSTTDGIGTAYAPRTLGPVGPHPLTAGVTALASAKFAGGNQAKPGTIVVAQWQQKNHLGEPDPAIAYRLTGPACVIQIGIAPHYPVVGVPGRDFGGDFYRVFSNAFDFAAQHCPTAAPGDFAQILTGWASRSALDYWRATFPYAITLDGASLQSGFGPALPLVTLPDGSIDIGG